MRSNIIPALVAAFCAMATLTAPAGSIDTDRPAAPATASAPAESENRTLGCGAGVVEVTWKSDSPVGLVVYDGNAPGAAGYDVRAAGVGAHAYASGRHTLTWSFVDGDGRPARPASDAVCVPYF